MSAQEASATNGPPIEIKGLSGWFGDQQVLNNVSFSFPPGQTIGVIGPSGSGKSTLLKCLMAKAKEQQPQFRREGKILINGVDIDKASNAERLRGTTIGMVMQTPIVFSSTVFENIAVGLRTNFPQMPELKIADDVMCSLDRANLLHEAMDKLHKPASELSGGQQQRLAIARSIALNPKILLLDEPTAALDPISRNKVIQLVDTLTSEKNGMTVVWVSHDIDSILSVSDELIYMEKGKIVESGPTADIAILPKTPELLAYLTHTVKAEIENALDEKSRRDGATQKPHTQKARHIEGPKRNPAELDLYEKGFKALTTGAALSLPVLFAGVAYTLVSGSWDILRETGPIHFLTTAEWDSNKNIYGGLAPIVGTAMTTALAVPPTVMAARRVAFYLSEVCHYKMRESLSTGIDALAAIPSVIYGLVGAQIGIPAMRSCVGAISDAVDSVPGLSDFLGNIPYVSDLYSGPNFGTSALTASVVLGFMVLPHIAAAMREALASIPAEIGQTARNLGMTTWEITSRIKFPHVKDAVKGGITLGLGRALGETMAVSFVIGSSNANQVVDSLFAPNTSITAMLANLFQESSGMQLSALMALGLTLFSASFAINANHQLRIYERVGKLLSSEKVLNSLRPMANYLARIKDTLPQFPSLNTKKSQERIFQARQKSNSHHILGARLATITALAVPAAILGLLAYNGMAGLSLDAFTHSTPAAAGLGEAPPPGGLLNSMVGTGMITGLAMTASSIAGVAAAIHLVEYGQDNKFTKALSKANNFIADNLLSTPSIIFGVFAYSALVDKASPIGLGHFSGLAGVAALASLALPTIYRRAVDAIKSVDQDFRRAGAAVGARRGHVQLKVILPIARQAVINGIMLATARIAGETAPLLWTALGNLNFNANLMQPMETMQNTIYRFAASPADNQVQLAWTCAMMVTVGVVGLNMLAKKFSSTKETRHRHGWRNAGSELTKAARYPVMTIKKFAPATRRLLRLSNRSEL